ncbi:hypothetical protein A2U01_0101518, partial [Trifolium medium]|nr:hypothetical protein [Trifolium medium]
MVITSKKREKGLGFQHFP